MIVASGAMLLFAGLFNVAELPYAIDELDAGDAGFGALTAVYGLGFVGGSLSGSRGGDAAVLKRRFLGGLALVGAGFIACGIAPTFAVAVPAFALAGIGNGLLLVYERLLIQTTVDDRLMARMFGVRDGLQRVGVRRGVHRRRRAHRSAGRARRSSSSRAWGACSSGASRRLRCATHGKRSPGPALRAAD